MFMTFRAFSMAVALSFGATLPAAAQDIPVTGQTLVASLRDACQSVGIDRDQRMALLRGWTRLDTGQANAAVIRFSDAQAFVDFMRENAEGTDMPPLADAIAAMELDATATLERLQDGLERGWATFWQGPDGWLLQFRSSESERSGITTCILVPGENTADINAELIDMVALLPPLAMPVGRSWILGSSQPLERGARNFGISLHLPNIGLNGAPPVPSLTLIYNEFRM